MESLALQLRRWRLAKGLSQRELAKLSGVARPNLIDIELGRRDCTVGTLSRLAVALRISPGALLDKRPSKVGSPKAALVKLNRQERDKIARFILTGKGELTKSQQKFAETLLPQFRSLFEAHHIDRKRTTIPAVRRHRYHSETEYSRELVNEICQRVRKLILSYATGTGTHE